MSNANALNMSGLDASKPGSGFIAGRTYFATDTSKLYYDSGSAWVDEGLGGGGGGGGGTLLNSYLASTDIYNATSFASGSWQDVSVANMSPTKGASGTLILVTVTMGILVINSGTAAAGFRINFDSGAHLHDISRGFASAGGTEAIHGGSCVISGLASGAHTFKLQVFISTGSPTLYCRASSQAPAECMAVEITEF